MKFRFLILLLFCSGSASADDAKEQGVDNQSPKKGDEIWLEEKISPTTTWIENLVKPLTTWMEQKINAPDEEGDSQDDSQRGEQQTTLEQSQTEADDTAGAASLLSAEQASALAKNHIDGDVLYIKLISRTNRYRVKLISTLGEIHIIYVNAVSGEITLRNKKTENNASTVSDSVGEAKTDREERP